MSVQNDRATHLLVVEVQITTDHGALIFIFITFLYFEQKQESRNDFMIAACVLFAISSLYCKLKSALTLFNMSGDDNAHENSSARNGVRLFPQNYSFKLFHAAMWALSHRGQHEELWRRKGQVRLLGQGPLRALAAGRRHHQDPFQEGSQWLVERRGVRPGESTEKMEKVFFYLFAVFLSDLHCSCVSRWGSFQPTMWRRITLTTADVPMDVICRLVLNV